MSMEQRLKLQVIVCGAVVMALELTASRILAPYFGSSIFVWGSLIGVVLAGMSAGYYVGGRVADKRPYFGTFCLIILTSGIFILLIPVVTPVVFDFIISLNLGERWSPLVASATILTLPSFLLGMISPYAIRLAAKNLSDIGNLAGKLYSLSTAGSILGTFITAFVLIPELGVVKILQLLGIVLVGLSLLGLRGKLRVVLVLVLVLSAFLAPPVSISPNVMLFKLSLNEVLLEKETLYHHMVIMEGVDPFHGGKVRTMILDDHLHSAMDLNDPQRIIYNYNNYFHMGFVFTSNVTNVLFIGGGGFSGPKRFLADYPNVSVDVVEIDDEVIGAAKRYFGVNDDPRMRIFNEDGRLYLVGSEKKYDLIVLDAYSRTYVPFHLMTLEFFREVSKDLTPNGVVVSNIIASLSGSSSELLKAECSTAKQVFSNIYVFQAGIGATESTRDYSTTQNLALVATKISKRYSKEELIAKAASSNVIKIADFHQYAKTLVEDEWSAVSRIVLTDDYAPVETLLNPLTGERIEKEERPPSMRSFRPSDLLILLSLSVILVAMWAQDLFGWDLGKIKRRIPEHKS
jgi:spermidine synthase